MSYPSLYERLTANIHEPENEQACWLWARKRDRWGYGQLNVWVPGLQRSATLKSHVALWCCVEAKCRTGDDLFLAYKEHVGSGLHLDHLCRVPMCINPDHLEVVTPSVNQQRRALARKTSSC